MIPITLKLKGLYSYQDEVEIDFNSLVEANLFGVFGATGSGKSSIIESIAFALYGETERLNKKDNRGYNMMNLKSNQLLIDFIFLAPNQKKYRFTVSAKRNSKNFEDIRTFERKAYLMIDDEWSPIPNITAEDILGLSYENFRRTIIIPQGKFEDFLKLGATDRTRMLKEIFSLNKFELSSKTSALEKKNQEEIQLINGQLTQIGEVNLEELELKKQELKKITKQVEEIALLLDKDQKKQSKFTELLEKEKDLNSQISQLEMSLKQDGEDLKKSSQELNELQKNWEKIKQEHANRHQFETKIKELNDSLKIQELISQLSQLEKRITDGQKLVDKNTKKLTADKKQLEDLKVKMKSISAKASNLTQLAEYSKWRQTQTHLQSQLKTTQEKAKSIEAEVQKIKDSLLNNLSNFPKANSLKESVSEVDTEIKIKELTKSIEAEIKLQKEKLEKLKLKSHFSKFAKELKPGDPCLLCGSKQHPAPQTESESSEQLLSATQKLEQLESHLRNAHQSSVLISEKQSQIKNLKNDQTQLEKQIQQHSEKKPEIKGLEPSQFDQFYEDAKKSQLELNQLKDQEEKLSSEIEKQLTEIERYRAGIHQLATQKSALAAKRTTIEEGINLLDKEKLMTASPESINQEINDLSEKLKQIEKDFTESEEKLKKLTQLNQELTGKITADNKSLAGIKEKLNAVQKELTEKSYNPESFAALQEKIIQTKNQLTELNQNCGHLQKEVSTFEKNIADAKALTKKLEKLKQRAQNITTLKNLFKASGFVNFVSTVYLQKLCQAANERFHKLTQRSLRLELTDDNNFQVRDFFNNGQLRSVKTLSGGQIFQASLSLALALADSVQQFNNSDHNFFFLDEGFGTLDEESLKSVFKTLKSLRQERKVVGIISHVEELKQEIDVFLSIDKHPEKGSIVRPSLQTI